MPDDSADEVERLYREMYPGFTAKTFHEHLRRDQGLAWATPGPRATCRGAAACADAPRAGRWSV